MKWAIIPLVLIALFASTGLVLDGAHAVIVNDFQVPRHPEWTQPGVVIDGSKLGFIVSQDRMVLVKGISWKNPLPPWDGHAKIRVVIAHPCGSGWCEERDVWGNDIVQTEVEVQPGTYSVKAWIDNGVLKIAYGSSGNYVFLYSYTLRTSNIEVWAESCTPRLVQVAISPSPANPIPSTSFDILKYALIGLGAIIVTIVIALAVVRRK